MASSRPSVPNGSACTPLVEGIGIGAPSRGGTPFPPDRITVERLGDAFGQELGRFHQRRALRLSVNSAARATPTEGLANPTRIGRTLAGWVFGPLRSGVMAQPVSTASRQVFKSANERCNRPYEGNEG